jgi:hypothetical protein
MFRECAFMITEWIRGYLVEETGGETSLRGVCPPSANKITIEFRLDIVDGSARDARKMV